MHEQIVYLVILRQGHLLFELFPGAIDLAVYGYQEIVLAASCKDGRMEADAYLFFLRPSEQARQIMVRGECPDFYVVYPSPEHLIQSI